MNNSMYDVNSIVSDDCKSDTFSYWVVKHPNNTNYLIVPSDSTEISENTIVGEFCGDGSCVVITSDIEFKNCDESKKTDVMQDVNRFIEGRPEWKVYNLDTYDCDDVFKYLTLLAGCILIKQSQVSSEFKTVDSILPRYVKCVEWLSKTDFFEAPASSRYHEAYSGGLLKHSLNVAYHAFKLTNLPEFDQVNVGDAVFISLIHDWCKIDLYETYYRNVKDEATGTWHKEPAYRTKSNPMANLGHGVSSMYLINQFFKLSYAECAAVRWHMGVWRCCDGDINELQYCNENYPIVHLIQFADQLSITKYCN